jgi:hypothetical protein
MISTTAFPIQEDDAALDFQWQTESDILMAARDAMLKAPFGWMQLMVLWNDIGERSGGGLERATWITYGENTVTIRQSGAR